MARVIDLLLNTSFIKAGLFAVRVKIVAYFLAFGIVVIAAPHLSSTALFINRIWGIPPEIVGLLFIIAGSLVILPIQFLRLGTFFVQLLYLIHLLWYMIDRGQIGVGEIQHFYILSSVALDLIVIHFGEELFDDRKSRN